jgi:hypothetical protein
MMPQHVVFRAIGSGYERRRDAYRQRHYKSGDDASLLLKKTSKFHNDRKCSDSDKNNTTRRGGKIRK